MRLTKTQTRLNSYLDSGSGVWTPAPNQFGTRLTLRTQQTMLFCKTKHQKVITLRRLQQLLRNLQDRL